MSDPKAVPLLELLRGVPSDAVLRIDTPNALGAMDTRSIPVGRYCHEAAAAVAQARAEERERCAKLAEASAKGTGPDGEPNCVWEAAYRHVCEEIAAAIRAHHRVAVNE